MAANCCARVLLKKMVQSPFQFHGLRFLSNLPKRFYKNVNIVQNGGTYGITLDNRRLKTPCGNAFSVNSEPLAVGVASEWESQKSHIQSHSMHLTGLSNTVIDNPRKMSKAEIVDSLVGLLDSDTILFRCEEPTDLLIRQEQKWDPVINWFNQRFETSIGSTKVLTGPEINERSKANVANYLKFYDDWCLHGIKFASENLSSLILALACVERQLSVKDAVHLSRLETLYQTEKWGNIPWSHDIELQDTLARVSSGVLFAHINSSSVFIKIKKKTNS